MYSFRAITTKIPIAKTSSKNTVLVLVANLGNKYICSFFHYKRVLNACLKINVIKFSVFIVIFQAFLIKNNQ